MMHRQRLTVVVNTTVPLDDQEVRDVFEKLAVTVESVKVERDATA